MTGPRRRRWAVGIVLALTSASGTIAQETGAWVEEGEIGPPQYFAVLVGDADASAAWYARAFGLREAGGSEAEDGSWKIVNLRNDRLFVEVIRDNRAGRADRVLGVRKVGFHVPDVRVVADRIEREGGERPRVLDFPEFGVRIVQIRDPDGTILQLFSDLAPDPGARGRQGGGSRGRSASGPPRSSDPGRDPVAPEGPRPDRQQARSQNPGDQPQ